MRISILATFFGLLLAPTATGQEPAASSNAVVTLDHSRAGAARAPALGDSPPAESNPARTPSARITHGSERTEAPQTTRTALPAFAAAQDGSTRRTATGGNWTPLASLGLVLGLIVVAARVMRSYLGASQLGLPSGALEVLGSSQIEPKLTLHVIRWGSRLLLVGSGPQGARSLAELSDAPEVDHLSELCRAHRPRAAVKVLRQVWNPAQGLGLRRRLTVPGEGRP